MERLHLYQCMVRSNFSCYKMLLTVYYSKYLLNCICSLLLFDFAESQCDSDRLKEMDEPSVRSPALQTKA